LQDHLTVFQPGLMVFQVLSCMFAPQNGHASPLNTACRPTRLSDGHTYRRLKNRCKSLLTNITFN